MESEIIQKEKERQERYLKIVNEKIRPENEIQGKIMTHLHSLINLKKYLEGLLHDFNCIKHWNHINKKLDKLKEDIKALSEMIERYK